MGLHGIKTLLGFYGLIFLSVVVQSCCEEDLLITSEGYVSAWEIIETENGSERNQIDTVTGDFYLSVVFVQQVVSENNYALIGPAFALTCAQNMLNEFDQNSMFVAIDQSFVWNEDTIPPNTNLLQLEDSGIEKNSNPEGYVQFHFTNNFFNQAALQNGEYTFYFKGRTSDNTELNTEIELTLAL